MTDTDFGHGDTVSIDGRLAWIMGSKQGSGMPLDERTGLKFAWRLGWIDEILANNAIQSLPGQGRPDKIDWYETFYVSLTNSRQIFTLCGRHWMPHFIIEEQEVL
jgi:hypothetical protein